MSITFLASVLEYLIAEMVELAGNEAKNAKRVRIEPRHILLAVVQDQELKELFKHVTIPGGGVLPNVHKFLLNDQSKKMKKRKNKRKSQINNRI